MKATVKKQTPQESTTQTPPAPTGRSGELVSMAIFVIAAVMVGVLITLFINSGGNEEPAKTTEEQEIEAALDSKYGEDWRSLGVTRWDYNPVSSTVFYYKPDAWGSLAKKRQVEILEELWADIKEYSGEQGDERDRVFIMVHDENSVMQAAYAAEDGMIEY